MAQTILLKRSALQGKVPDTGSLQLGEVAINTYDGKAYIKRSGSVESIQEFILTNTLNTGSINLLGSQSITGSLNVSNGITGSLFGTASYAISASHAPNALTSSYALSSSYAQTSSYADNFTVAGTLTAQTIVAQIITSSTEYITGSTIFGSSLTNTHQFTGSVTITGSLAVNGVDYTSTSASFNTRILANSSSIGTLSSSFLNTSASLSASISQLSGSYLASSASFDTRILNNSSSIGALSSSFLNASSSFDTRILNNSSSIGLLSSSFLNTSASLSASISQLSGSFLASSASFDTRILANSSSIGALSSSFLNASSSFDTRILNNSSSIGILSSSFLNTSASLSASISQLSGSYLASSASFDSRILANSSSIGVLSSSFLNTSASLSASISQLSGSYLASSASFDSRILANSSSIGILSSSFLSTSSSLDQRVLANSSSIGILSSSYLNSSASFDSRILNNSSSIGALSSSYLDSSASFDSRILANSSSIGALSSSFLNFSSSFNTGSFSGSFTGSFRGDGSAVTGVISASYAQTASFANDFTVAGTLTAQTIVAQVITSSTEYVTGSTIFGSQLSNTHQFTGSVTVTGSLAVNNSAVITTNQTSSMSVLSSSYAYNADFLDGKDSSEFATTGSNVFRGNQTITGSLLVTGSTVQIGNNTLTGNTSLTGSVAISGSTVQVGNNTLLGNTTLSGSIVISGSFPVGSYSSSVNIYGDTAMTGYLRFNPQSTNIETTTSASYIFVSGSTNDLYFAQNGSGYSNTTRLRWIEGNLYTGLLNGGVITSQSSTVYQISSGSGIIVNLNASLSNNPFPTIQYLNWPNLSASIAPLSASYDQAFVGIDNTGNIFQQGTPFSDGQFDVLINVGVVLFSNHTSINGVKTQPSVAYGAQQSQNIFNRAFGPLKLSGFTLATSGSSTGSLVVGSGTAYAPGSNYTIDPNNPSYDIDAGTNVSKIWRYYDSGSNFVYDTNAGAGYATIDPTRYSNNGVLTAVPGTGANREWTNQRVFWFPNSVSKAIVVYYGNVPYATEVEAIANIPYEYFIEAPNTAANAIYLGTITVRNDADFTNAATFKIQPGGLFRSVGGSGGGGSVVTQTLAGLSDVQISGPTNGQPLVYNSTAAKWENLSYISGSVYGNAQTATSASQALTASYANVATSASYAFDSTSGSYAFNATSASYAFAATSASYAVSASHAPSALTASYAISASQAITASYANIATSASYANIATSASYANNATSASYAAAATSASYANVSTSSSYAATSSFANDFTVAGTLTAQTIVVQTITSSVDYVTGSTIFGSQLSNTHQFTGSVTITGSLAVNGSNVILTNQTSSMTVLSSSYALTASFAQNIHPSVTASYAVSASQAVTASYANVATSASYAFNSTSGSYAVSASQATTSSFADAATSASYALTASYASNVPVTASYAISASQAQNAVSSSYANAATSASYALTASYASNVPVTASYAISSSQATSSSYAITASYSLNVPVTSSYAISASQAITASYAMNAGGGAGFPFSGSAVITGSFLVTQSFVDFTSASYVLANITGSLYGTASYALTAISASNAPGFTTNMSQSVAAATWSFNHNLDTRNPIVQVYDTNYKQIIPNEIVGVNAFLTEIRFTYAQAGYAVASNGGGLYVTGSTPRLVQTTAATTWSFAHKLGTKYPGYEVFDSNDNVIIPAGIKSIDVNNAEIYFAFPTTGVAIANFSGISGSLDNAISASYAVTASYSLNVPVTSSYAISASQAITASYSLNVPVTSSYAISSSQAVTASFANNATSASYAVTASYSLNVPVTASYAISSSQAVTSSYAEAALSSSYALTASFSLNVPVTASYAISASQAVSASYAATSSYADNFTVGNTLTATTLVVNTVSSSVVYSSGSNVFGNSLSNTQVMTGSVNITGSLTVNGTTATLGTGTTNTVPKFTAANIIGNSNIQDDGTLITLGSNTYVNGALGIGSTSLTGITLNIAKNLTGAIASTQVFAQPVIQSDVTGTAVIYNAFPSTQAAAFTLGNLYYYQANQSTIGASSAVTTQIGFRVASSLTGATNNFAFRSELAAATNTWNLYMNGTANNYLAGALGIGSTSLTGYNLRIAKTITGGTSAYGIRQQGQVQSDVTTTAIGIWNTFSTVGAAFTLGSYVHLNINQDALGAGSTVTNQYGIFIDSSLTGASNNYGIYGNIATSGSRNWNLYINGTAPNYLAGNTGIGKTPTTQLDVSGSTFITGSLNVTQGITGSLFGTSSFAISASFASTTTSASFATSATSAVTSSYSDNLIVKSTLTLDATITDYASVNSSIVGTNNLFARVTGSYTSAFMKYTAKNGTNSRTGELMVVWNGSNIEYTDVSTNDIGNTSAVTMSAALASTDIQLNAITNTSGWSIKSLATFM